MVQTLKLVNSVVTLVLKLFEAGVNHEAATKSANAKEAQNEADRHKLLAEMMQQQIEEEAAIMKMIMESKNQTVDAVLKMMNAMFATKNKIMSVGMTR